MMNLRDIQYFAVVAEHRHLGRAAESLGLSQPALSMSLRRLERFMQTKLVKRTPKGIDLTVSGEAVFSHARRLRLSVDDISREVSDLSQGHAGHVRLGIDAGFGLHLLSASCDYFLKDAPKATLQVAIGDRNTTLTALRNGDLDLVVSALQMPRYEDIVEMHLFNFDYAVYAAANHRLVRRKRLTLADLVQERWATGALNAPAERHLSQAFADRGLPPPDIAMVLPYLSFRNRVIAQSDLLAFGPRMFVHVSSENFRIAKLDVKELAFTRALGVSYRKDAYLSPAARRFIEILKSTAVDIVSEPKVAKQRR